MISKEERIKELKKLKKEELVLRVLKLEKEVEAIKAKISGKIGYGAVKNPHVK